MIKKFKDACHQDTVTKGRFRSNEIIILINIIKNIYLTCTNHMQPACFCLRAFALAAPFACNTLMLGMHKVSSLTSFRFLCKGSLTVVFKTTNP